MTSFLSNLHQVFGYALFVGMLAVAVLGFVQAGRDTAFDARPFRAVAGLVTLELLLGVVTYVVITAWEQPFGQAVLHPLLMVLGVGMAHAAVSRGSRTEGATAAWRGAATMLATSVVFVTAGIGVASAT